MKRKDPVLAGDRASRRNEVASPFAIIGSPACTALQTSPDSA
jgi:hypothetical protein